MLRFLEKISLNLASFLPVGSPTGMRNKSTTRIFAKIAAIPRPLGTKPMRPSAAAPIKKLQPLTALFELILTTPEIPWTSITKTT